MRPTDAVITIDGVGQLVILPYKVPRDDAAFARSMRALVFQHPEVESPLLELLLASAVHQSTARNDALPNPLV